MLKLNRLTAFAFYAAFVLMIVIPFGEIMAAIMPLNFGDPAWRFGAAGLFSRALPSPLLGLVLLSALAIHLDHRRTLRAASVVAGILALMLVVGAALFILDALQMRAQINPDAQIAYDLSSIMALFRFALISLALAALAVGLWRMPRGGPAKADKVRGPESLVLKRRTSADEPAVDRRP